MKHWRLLAAAAATAVAVACGADAVSPVDGGPVASRGTNGGGGGTDTSNGSVASVTITPHNVILPVGTYAGLIATARDAAGARVAKLASWRSSNAAIVAVVSDTGVLLGKAVGTAKVYATIDGFTDSATVTVTPAPPPPPPPTPPAAEFNMTVTAFGQLAGADTSKTERIAGATVKLQRLGGVTGDTLTTPVDAGTAVTDANGEARFTRLAGGSYSIRVTPPAGSVYVAGTMGIGPPRETDINVHVKLQRK